MTIHRGDILTDWNSNTLVVISAPDLITRYELITVWVNTGVTPQDRRLPNTVYLTDTNGAPIGEAATWRIRTIRAANAHHTGRTTEPGSLANLDAALRDTLHLNQREDNTHHGR